MAGQLESQRRRSRWWIIPLVLVLALAAAVVWIFRFRIARVFEAAPTAPPTLAVPSAGEGEVAVLYETGFDADAEADWELFSDGIISAGIEDGRLAVGVNSLVDAGGYSGLNYTFGDFVLEVDATKVAGPDNNAMFVVFRLTDVQNYNRFDISSDGYYSLSKVRDGIQTTVSDWMPAPAILTGDETNRIRVEARGDTFRFAVNGEALPLCISYEEGVRPIPMDGECNGGEMADEWVDASQPQGKIGLGVQGYTGFDGEQTTPAEAAAAFDDLVIAAPKAAD